MVKVDSLTELAPEVARADCNAIKSRTGMFLSINHEANPFTVRQIAAEADFPRASRAPYWMRRGYVEELFRF